MGSSASRIEGLLIRARAMAHPLTLSAGELIGFMVHSVGQPTFSITASARSLRSEVFTPAYTSGNSTLARADERGQQIESLKYETDLFIRTDASSLSLRVFTSWPFQNVFPAGRCVQAAYDVPSWSDFPTLRAPSGGNVLLTGGCRRIHHEGREQSGCPLHRLW